MTLNEYQKKAMSTCMPSCENFAYMMLNLVGEVGELSSKVAKAIRKNEVSIDNEMLLPIGYAFPEHFLDDVRAEAGDILWQLSGLCEVLGFPLEEVAQKNLDKLASRKKRGVIDGNGDNR